MQIAGLVGKPNSGKSTLFSALTLIPVEIANFPFTTIKPNRGIAYLTSPCVCKEFGVKDNPKNSTCNNGIRFIPIEMIDCPGIIYDAHKGRGLGLQFLDEIRQADALIVVCDASGSTDMDGNIISPGKFDPVEDIKMIEREYAYWIKEIIKSEWDKIIRSVEARKSNLTELLEKKLTGLGIKAEHIEKAYELCGLDNKKPSNWNDENLLEFSKALRKIAKPFIIAANKIDIPIAEENIKKLKELGYPVIPCSAEAERILRLAASNNLIRYIPGDNSFKIIDESKLNQKQLKVLKMIDEKVLAKWNSTGVQQLINETYFKILKYIPVYPVEDVEKLTDHDGNVLPDVYLLPDGSTIKDLAYKIHTELGKGFLYGIDARTKMRLSDNYKLKWNDVVSIVSAMARG